MNKDLSFYKGKRVLITGHTGFKGSWLTRILENAGAEVVGYSLEPETAPALFNLAHVEEGMLHSEIGDVRDLEKLLWLFKCYKPEIVFHLAAQPIVRTSYEKPVETFDINVMGTVNVLEAVRRTGTTKSVLNVTTDKVYKNKEWYWGYRECEELGGYDPYSSSKAVSEEVTRSYINSFWKNDVVRVSTARAGNVIGGGDFAKDRIIPDCVRAAMDKTDIFVRNPNSVRPFQHVLEPLFAYLLIAKMQQKDAKYVGNYNVGPDETDCVTVGKIATMFCDSWQDGIKWTTKAIDGPHEANFLKLDCSKIKSELGWSPTWNIEKAIEKTVEFSKIYATGGDVSSCMNKQICEFIGGK